MSISDDLFSIAIIRAGLTCNPPLPDKTYP